jgi:DNA-binding IclR family transcriptional regulator
MGDVPTVKLTAPVKAVLAVLADQHGHKLPVSAIARGSRVSPATVRKVLAELGKARLVQHQLLPSSGVHPPRLAYWLTGAGHDVASAARPAAG